MATCPGTALFLHRSAVLSALSAQLLVQGSGKSSLLPGAAAQTHPSPRHEEQPPLPSGSPPALGLSVCRMKCQSSARCCSSVPAIFTGVVEVFQTSEVHVISEQKGK